LEIRLAAFDLDGTIVRGPTCVVAIATAIGRVAECLEFEKLTMRDTAAAVAAARATMAEWYRHHAIEDLTGTLEELPLAPGSADAFTLLRQAGVKTAIVSITWSFAVDWFAERLGADYAHGTRLTKDGIEHVWPPDKGRWLDQLAGSLGVDRESVAAVGDSDGDRELLEAAGLRFFVGRVPPAIPEVIHLPDADLLSIAQQIVACGAAIR
jgi:HAD superfamily phosphoserine phosphatase-like hydrolase